MPGKGIYFRFSFGNRITTESWMLELHIEIEAGAISFHSRGSMPDRGYPHVANFILEMNANAKLSKIIKNCLKLAESSKITSLDL